MSCLSFLFTDFYELTMAYSYWKNGMHNNNATFALYFRKNPFGGQFTIFAGINRFLDYLQKFVITDEDISFIKSKLPTHVEQEFYEYLKNLNLENVEIHAITEGTVVFPTVPLIQLCGPIAVLTLLETILINLTNYASLVCTNAAHFRLAAGTNVTLSEFGCRRAQGPDGALSGSLYSYIGGFDTTSNTLASKLYGVPLSGTVAHSFVSSFFASSSENTPAVIETSSGLVEKLMDLSLMKLKELEDYKIINSATCSLSELNAFVRYASSFPSTFVAIIDTYNVTTSGLPNFCAVSLALYELGYKAVGIRIDSGDLAYLSLHCRDIFKKIEKCYKYDWFSQLTIIASNEISVDILSSLNTQHHEINVFGIGTNLVTCTYQPSLGMVYKLAEHDKLPTMKTSEDIAKASIPFMKRVYRLYNSENHAIFDLLTLWDEPPPIENRRVICVHPHHGEIRAYVVPSKVEELQKLVFFNNALTVQLSSIQDTKKYVQRSLNTIRPDHIRLVNPTPYKISLSQKLFDAFHNLMNKLPVPEIH